ncbi:MAG TPA: hypothetical protein VE575_07405 [Acidimicrobiales bacterium]|jgi:hypothetical protein|nr:hypothetical protein [Acidimicrobiales bacterium]
MVSVTIKDIDPDGLEVVTRKAAAAGMSVQEYLRRLIARDAAQPLLPNQLAELARQRREGRTPLSMEEFNRIRRRALGA